MSSFFITGTDTDAGKTVLTALLLSALHQRGHPVLPMKPAQTGCTDTIPDLDYALALSGIAADSALKALMAPACYTPACSPHLAAEMENRPLTLAGLIDAYHALRPHAETLLIEGAGGALVPLNRKETMLDLMTELQLPILIAARPGLGTINHTLLTIKALHQRNLSIAGFVFIHTRSDGSDFTESDNARTIAEFGQIPWLGTIPYIPDLDTPTPMPFSKLPAATQYLIQEILEKILP
jgi:dethiobiotin synthase